MTLGGRESGGFSSTGTSVFGGGGGAECLVLFFAGSFVEATLTAFTDGLRTRNDRFGGIVSAKEIHKKGRI